MDQIANFLTRAVANIIPGKAELEKVLRTDKKLNVYLGIDPTATRIHLGHAVPLHKLQQLVDLGHHVTFLIGDYTALIGDTSDKDGERPVLTSEQIEANFITYQTQASKILDFSKVKVVHNSDWLKDFGYAEIIQIGRQFSLNDFISRELIKKRLDAGTSISIPEVLYPIAQGYDSYYMDTDLQIGGTDQTFNMQAGRTLQKRLRNKESFVLTTPFLTGTDGRKMSKSWGNAIWLDDSPNDIYGKVMSIRDDLITEYFTLATNITDIPTSDNPMQLKKQLAHTIVSELCGSAAAAAAQTHFESTFQQGQAPTDIPTMAVTATNIIDVLVETKLASSKSDARRLIDQGGVKVNDKKISDLEFRVSSLDLIQVGPLRFLRIK